MIEVLVAMSLFAVALALVTTNLLSGISGSSTARAGSVSDQAVARTMSAFSSDIAAAQTPDRRDDMLRDPNALARAVQAGGNPLSTDPSIAARPVDLDDVVTAQGNAVQVRADVDQAAGTECVTWRTETASGRVSLVRLVDATCPGATAGGGAISKRSYSWAPATLPGLDPTPFAFRVVSPGACRPTLRDAVAGVQRRWVVAVDVALVNVTTDRTPTKGAGSTSTLVRSRETGAYRKALGC
ncbi:MAG: hypothetical protein JWO69_504 [Thermoleophilia bacterium]|jgi:type II secretory pathway pseudopilin PulG|nr:hypothetical protein [Thermoleophilia bacterium]